LIRDCDDVLAGASGTDPLSKYTKALSAPQEKIARDYLARLSEQLVRALRAVGIVPPEADRILDGVVSKLQELARDFTTFLTGVSDDVIRQRLERLAPTQPLANDYGDCP
jgi:hypothetical protein